MWYWIMCARSSFTEPKTWCTPGEVQFSKGHLKLSNACILFVCSCKLFQRYQLTLGRRRDKITWIWGKSMLNVEWKDLEMKSHSWWHLDMVVYSHLYYNENNVFLLYSISVFALKDKIRIVYKICWNKNNRNRLMPFPGRILDKS